MPWEIYIIKSQGKNSNQNWDSNLGPPDFMPGMRTRIAQVVERRARNMEVRGSNPSSGSNFSLVIL